MADYNRNYARRSSGRNYNRDTRRSTRRNDGGRNYRRNDTYIHGNVVVAPEYEEAPRRTRVYRQGTRVLDTRKGVKYREAMEHYSITYVLAICLMTAALIGLGVIYVKTDNEVSKKQSNINQLEQEINILTSENEVYNYNVNSYIDTDYIIKTAKKELGMVEAKSNQINYYKKSSSEYMKQLEDIPEE